MYGGSTTLWQKFNNSLYLRLLMRVRRTAQKWEPTQKSPRLCPAPASTNNFFRIRKRCKMHGYRPVFQQFPSKQHYRATGKANTDCQNFAQPLLLTGRDSKKTLDLPLWPCTEAATGRCTGRMRYISDARRKGLLAHRYTRRFMRDATLPGFADIPGTVHRRKTITGGKHCTHPNNAVTLVVTK